MRRRGWDGSTPLEEQAKELIDVGDGRLKRCICHSPELVMTFRLVAKRRLLSEYSCRDDRTILCEQHCCQLGNTRLACNPKRNAVVFQAIIADLVQDIAATRASLRDRWRNNASNERYSWPGNSNNQREKNSRCSTQSPMSSLRTRGSNYHYCEAVSGRLSALVGFGVAVVVVLVVAVFVAVVVVVVVVAVAVVVEGVVVDVVVVVLVFVVVLVVVAVASVVTVEVLRPVSAVVVVAQCC